MSAREVPRVAYVLKVFPRLSQTFILNEVLDHQAAGFPLMVFSLKPAKDEPRHGCLGSLSTPVTYLPSPQDCQVDPSIVADAGVADRDHVAWASHLAQELLNLEIDHVHAHFATGAATVARLAARRAGISYSFTAHARDVFHETVDREALRHKLDDAMSVVTVSEYNARYLRGISSRCRVEVVYNGVDLSSIPLRADWAGPPEILAVGRLVEKKGFALLLDSFALIRDRFPGARLQLIGSGPLESALKERARTLGLADSCVFHGAQPLERVAKAMREAAILVVPSIVADDGDREGLPTVLIEAMAHGTPCVATRSVGVGEIVRDGITGVLVERPKPQALAEACGALLSDPERRRRLAVGGRALVESRFDLRKTGAALRRIFSRAVNVDSSFSGTDVQ